MSDPYVGEIRPFAGNFAPLNWAFCDGQTVAISDNTTLFTLIGTTYGGDGVTTFNLPDLRGRTPVHQGTLQGGSTYVLGQMAGASSVTLTPGQIPAHSHAVVAAAQAGTASSPSGAVYAQPTGIKPYRGNTPSAAMATPISPAGGSQPHDNVQPYVAVNYIISLYGIFPSQS